MASAKTGSDSARRALDIVFAFEKQSTASVKELSELTGMPLPTTHRYVAMLREMGLVEEARHGEYRLTMRWMAVGNAARRATSLIDVVQPFMQQLSEETEETVLLVQPVAGLPVCTHRVEARRRLRLSFEVGQPMPPLRGASARLLLSILPPQERREQVQAALHRGEQMSVPELEAFLEQIGRDAEQGWAISSEEIDDGVWSAAALIRCEGAPIGTLSAPCPIFRIDDKRGRAILAAVQRTAAEISAALGS